MKVAVIGVGYVGTTTCVALAGIGHKVIGIDLNLNKVELLNNGILPFYEEGMEILLKQHIGNGNLTFSIDMAKAVEQCEIIFIAVGTPSLKDGSADVSFVEEVARQIGQIMQSYKLVVNKSTVPVGTAEIINHRIRHELNTRTLQLPFDVVSNPEFLREGKAIHDAMNPERVIIGYETVLAKDVMIKLYEGVNAPFLFTSLRDAEMIKCASNAYLATKISFVNELARLCDQTHTDIKQVTMGMGMDSRIGNQFLNAGIGYGGSCFPKDVNAIIQSASKLGISMQILQSVSRVNETQVDWFMDKVKERMGPLNGKRIAILGLTFKPETDDIREAPSLRIILQLLHNGAAVTAYDPKGMEHMNNIYPQIEYASNPYESLTSADAVLLVTEWKEFIHLDWQRARSLMVGNLVFDGRNALDPLVMSKLGYHYIGAGR